MLAEIISTHLNLHNWGHIDLTMNNGSSYVRNEQRFFIRTCVMNEKIQRHGCIFTTSRRCIRQLIILRQLKIKCDLLYSSVI